MKTLVLPPLISLLFFLCIFTANANIRLPRLISDGMVLQRDVRITIWGWASNGEKISVNFQNDTFVTTAGEDGKWRISLPAYKAGGPFVMVIRGDNEIVIKDILIGDVWVCSGQSNMEFKLEIVKDRYARDIEEAKNFNIRQFKVLHNTSFKVLDDIQSNGWKTANERTVLDFSAVAYFFAVELYAKYKIPVGIINISVGGSSAESWMSLKALKKFPNYINEYNRVHKIFEGTDKVNFSLIVKSEGIKLERVPSCLFNAMVAPLIPNTIKGVIWYQGERNAFNGKSYEYSTLFPALIDDWRKHWGQGIFPFIYVQLPNFKDPASEPEESSWAELREAQLMAFSVPNTGMAVTIDIGEAKNLHPHNKKDVGKRLALAAQKVAYNDKNVVYSGPIYQAMETNGNKIILKFKNTGSGLIAKGNDRLTGFSIAGKDKKFFWANAIIHECKVIVWNDNVQFPVAVRYAWADNPEGSNLYNQEGLPASPFRTDDWHGITYPSEKK